MAEHVVVIGAGFGGISAAAYLAREGYRVTVLEKNAWVGGRARVLDRDGYRMDMGPSWYWMPDQHDRWFTDMGADRRDYYDIHRVDPSYKVFFGDIVPGESRNVVTVPADLEAAKTLFESYEPGAGAKLEAFLAEGRKKYEFAMSGFIFQNFRSIFDMVNKPLLKNLTSLNLFKSYRALIQSRFSHPYLQRILEFPVVFLGSFAKKTPGVYTLMNHIDFDLGTWYPDGGFGRVVQSMQEVAESLGVEFRFDSEVIRLSTASDGRVREVFYRSGPTERTLRADIVVANADYPHVELDLLDSSVRSKDSGFWNRKTYAPGVLNFYLGVDHPLPNLEHHTFFFDSDWHEHFDSVYGSPKWPADPLFYLHIPSKTDPNCAPTGREAVFILVPIAMGLDDPSELRERYFTRVSERIRELAGEDVSSGLDFRESMSISEFQTDYNAYGGTAFGLGQTLFQTAVFRPGNRSPKVPNLYFAGHYTVPGTGTTMSMISGAVVAKRIREDAPA